MSLGAGLNRTSNGRITARIKAPRFKKIMEPPIVLILQYIICGGAVNLRSRWTDPKVLRNRRPTTGSVDCPPAARQAGDSFAAFRSIVLISIAFKHVVGYSMGVPK